MTATKSTLDDFELGEKAETNPDDQPPEQEADSPPRSAGQDQSRLVANCNQPSIILDLRKPDRPVAEDSTADADGMAEDLDEDPIEEVRRRLLAAEEKFSIWADSYKHNRRMEWDTLAELYAACKAAEKSDEARRFLVDQAKDKKMTSYGKPWSESGKSLYEIVVDIHFGFDEEWKYKKCRWLKALNAYKPSSEDEDPHSGLMKWLEKGGVHKAGRASDPGNAQPWKEPQRYTFDRQNFYDAQSAIAEELPIVQLPPGAIGDAEEGLWALLAIRLQDDPSGQLRLIKPCSGEEADSLAAIVDAGVTGRATFEENILWVLNSMAILHEGGIGNLRGKFKLDHMRRFSRALKVLEKNAELRERYFSGAPSTSAAGEICDPETDIDKVAGEPLHFSIANPAFDKYDPGRLIRNGRQGALVPYGEGKAFPDVKTYVECQLERRRLKRRLASKWKNRAGVTKSEPADQRPAA